MLAALFIPILIVGAAMGAAQSRSAGSDEVPEYVWDPTWPKQAALPNNWVTGAVVGVAVDAKDHVWVVHRPRAALAGTQGECCSPAPSVIEFDQGGNFVQAWGGRTAKPPSQAAGATSRGADAPAQDVDWVESEHNIAVDYKDNIWLGNNGGSFALKLTRTGRLVLRLGRPGAKGPGSNDTDALGAPTGIFVHPKDNEVYVADGYGNRRVIVFDADTGAYKRHWGAYGKRPDDSVPIRMEPGGPPAQQFHTVHCVQIDKDDLVWVCDRTNARIQVFKKDGTFVKEAVVGPARPGTTPVVLTLTDGRGGTVKMPMGSVFDLAFSRDPQQRYVFVADGRNEKIWILRRSDMTILGSFGHSGHWGGGFTLPHNLAVDSKSNVYVSESQGGARVQRFLYKGPRAAR
jgi:DNA-binding beta-propeller fold protein YncE